MANQFIHFTALFLLLLVTGVFWGPWFALHRSLKVFNAGEFLHIVKTLAANLAVPMRILMPACLLFMLLSVWFFPQKNSLEFYLNAGAFLLTIFSLIITLAIEVPIVTQIQQWTPTTLPPNWEAIRDRWIKFHIIRTFSSLLSFACYSASVLFL